MSEEFSQPKTREELYERIKNSSKDEVIIEEMVRLGFWTKGVPLPEDPLEEVESSLYRTIKIVK